MGDSQNSALFELLGDNLLNNRIIFDIDVSCSLVYQHYLAMLQEGSTNAKELFFTC